MLVLAEFELDLGRDAEIIYESLLPELGEDYTRTKSTMSLKNNVLILTVEAGDIVSMRAALNGWLRLLKITTEMCSVTQVIN